ncbi:Ryncolin-2,Ficolin-1-A,Fibrinogen C domain-containing protein 1-A,Fibrinogen C domain-containing protein 1,Fibrinogen C domain-containing protein 1-B,Ryncolin-1,Tenascin-X,Ficolin-2,Ficolin-1,Fibrinogen-like protein A,Ficolin-1-B,Ryncolin-3,Angiopoietin-related protein 7,Ryncolin-4 [Mytilus edulis]|uniref:Fibrinogen C-terminal domain-containing protein n=1 Tax=Mytilus edulis TaxID=6550 RepID=A0A8S3Q168_MYTED|nr:Ryncolin-2,Ficolin-1-A,Fibrinogen C domain-containing protein 1-A,Fibrinogen C domain-containing protein 1,Fibrinogen C domain-containing protein 1-B,Ryncolin-1,Tenascin-X,Ficolin-2,Ficolin-1,Fibrinogen-like protein A,Ficolin-1-B,Ryncolin-3,Angiopoietin-related protein 7,Ryncolin-4 [Mytilus edulis]
MCSKLQSPVFLIIIATCFVSVTAQMNLALHGTVAQETTYTDRAGKSYTANLAVEGPANNNWEDGCSATAANQKTAWWGLLFPKLVYITNVKRYSRKDNLTFEIWNMQKCPLIENLEKKPRFGESNRKDTKFENTESRLKEANDIIQTLKDENDRILRVLEVPEEKTKKMVTSLQKKLIEEVKQKDRLLQMCDKYKAAYQKLQITNQTQEERYSKFHFDTTSGGLTEKGGRNCLLVSFSILECRWEGSAADPVLKTLKDLIQVSVTRQSVAITKTVMLQTPEAANIKRMEERFNTLENSVNKTLVDHVGRDDVMRDCVDWQQSGMTTNGIYSITPIGFKPFDVYCDMTTDGGGWLVFQRRIDGTIDFFKEWVSYENGFGDINSEFWLGNKKLHVLTQEHTELRVDVMAWDNEKRYAKYSTFRLGDASSKYTLYVDGYSGDAGDGLFPLQLSVSSWLGLTKIMDVSAQIAPRHSVVVSRTVTSPNGPTLKEN